MRYFKRALSRKSRILSASLKQIREIAHMRVGVGLPTGIPGTSSRLIIEWAHKADKGPFSSLGVIDRLVYDSYEPLTTLATAAAVTSRVKLVTAIVIGPLHADAML